MKSFSIVLFVSSCLIICGCRESGVEKEPAREHDEAQTHSHGSADDDSHGHDHGSTGGHVHESEQQQGHDHGSGGEAVHQQGHDHESGTEAGLISFSREQQEGMEFAAFEVSKRAIYPSIQAFGTLRARSDGETIISAPLAGRVLTVGKAFPKVGDDVKRDQLLVSLAPRLEDSADQASLVLNVERAELALKQAKIDYERLSDLFKSGAVAESRVIAAKSQVSTTEAELKAAEKRLGQQQRLSRTAGASGGGIQIRSPIAGTITSVDVRPGIFTNEGQVLFHIDDLDRLWLEAQVTEVNIGRLGKPSSAWFEADGFEKPFHIEEGKLVAVGGVIDPRTRTTPVIFEFDNPGRRLRIGMAVKVHLKVGESKNALVVPRSAVIREEGRDVVMVQRGEQSFERRNIELGIKDSEYLEVINGLEEGERVVSKGTYAVKLAGSSSEVPAHGHAH